VDVRALARRSVEVIREGQAVSGAYVACPSFEPYRGEVESAEAFFDWCARVILARRDREWLAARYTLEGDDDASEWPLLQHDGYGLWLWALRGHGERHARPGERWRDAANVTVEYLARVRETRCTDWWEERDGLHTATLACIAAGLGERGEISLEDRVDASQLVLVPLGLGGPEAVGRVERELVSPGGGVHRHREDVYYGGGEWLLLTALLGWTYAERGYLSGGPPYGSGLAAATRFQRKPARRNSCTRFPVTARVAIVGSGLAALTAYATLRRGGIEAGDMAVFGPDPDPASGAAPSRRSSRASSTATARPSTSSSRTSIASASAAAGTRASARNGSSGSESRPAGSRSTAASSRTCWSRPGIPGSRIRRSCAATRASCTRTTSTSTRRGWPSSAPAWPPRPSG
jgi:hypothetical protein